jgi:lysozyme family protein
MTPFEKALKHTLGIEGDFSNHPLDSGGATRYGITEQVARQWGYDGDMSALPLGLAKRVYKHQYWDLIKLDDIALIAPPVAFEMFDTSVNCGQARAVQFLQRALNLFNLNGKYYSDLDVDGLVGRNTLNALAEFVRRRGNMGVEVLVTALNCLQGAFYTELAERRPKDEAFTYGWFLNRVMKRVDA